MVALPKKVLLLLGAVIVVILLIVFGISSFKSPATFVKLDDGILVKVTNPYSGAASRVRLQAITNKVIHVTAGFSDSITSPSLIAVNNKGNAKWQVVQKGDQLVLE